MIFDVIAFLVFIIRLSAWADRSARMPWRDRPWLVDTFVPGRVPDDKEEWTEVAESQG